MTIKSNRRVRILALLAASGLAVAACGGAKVGDVAGSPTPGNSSVPAKACGTVNIAVNPWVGYSANAAVVAYVAESKLGCKVTKKDLKEDVSWQGFETGEVDVVLENWGHDDLVKKYITEKKVAVDLGPTGNKGIIGWYVPQWMADEHPDITDSKNLNKYADLFKTSESGDLGQLLDGDPSYVTNDVALVKNLQLKYKVVTGGSEAALIKSLETATKQKKALLFYFYEPQWALNNYKVARVNLPAYTAGCDADPAKVACDYPPYILNKIVSQKFIDSASPAVALMKNFAWTNDDQNLVAKYISEDGMTPEAAGKKWADDNPDKVNAWLK